MPRDRTADCFTDDITHRRLAKTNSLLQSDIYIACSIENVNLLNVVVSASRSGKTDSRPTGTYPGFIRSQCFTTNIAVPNGEHPLEGDITNLPLVSKIVMKATTWLWFSGNPPECDLGQYRVANPRFVSRFTYIPHTGQTNSQTFRVYLCLHWDKDKSLRSGALHRQP